MNSARSGLGVVQEDQREERNTFEGSMVTCMHVKGLIDDNGGGDILRGQQWLDLARKREKGGLHELPGKEGDVTTGLA